MNNNVSRSVVILAGGASKRFEGHEDKLMSKVDGVPLIARVLTACKKAGIENLFVATNPINIVSNERNTLFEALNKSDITFVHDTKAAGPVGGLIAALENLPSSCDVVFVLGADLPLLNEKTLSYLENKLDSQDGCVACVAVDESGSEHPTCMLWRPAALRLVVEAVVGKQKLKEKNRGPSLHSLLRHQREAYGDHTVMRVMVFDSRVLYDVDTHADLERVQRLI